MSKPIKNKYVFGGKLYDLEKSKLIASDFFERQSLYKTQKGNFFVVRNWRGFILEFFATPKKEEENRALTVEEAKEWLLKNNLLDVFQKEFGEVEEA